jgi:hypothetical protein
MICSVMSLPRATSYSSTKKQSTIEYIFRHIGDNRVLNILLKMPAIPVSVGSSQRMLFNSNEWAATTFPGVWNKSEHRIAVEKTMMA